MHPIIKTGLYGLSVFAIYTILAVVLRLVTHHTPVEGEYFGLISNKDILLGFALAFALTFTHERKKKLK